MKSTLLLGVAALPPQVCGLRGIMQVTYFYFGKVEKLNIAQIRLKKPIPFSWTPTRAYDHHFVGDESEA